MATKGKPEKQPDSPYYVAPLVTPSGERLPILCRRDTGVPCELALRWQIAARRSRVAASTARDDQRAVQRIYEWAEHALGESLDDYLMAWRELTPRQLTGLAQWVKAAGDTGLAGGIGASDAGLAPAAFNARWRKIGLFLCWAAEWYSRDERGRRGQQRAIADAQARIVRLFGQHVQTVPLYATTNWLSADEWACINAAISLDREDVWPDPRIRFRNRVMVFMAINLGLRIGELLKLTLNQLPRGPEEHLEIRRRPDDPHDTRGDEPAVKTSERELYVPRFLRGLQAEYTATYRYPSPSPYVFIAQGKRPLSSRGARHICERITKITGVPLGWHRFRHTFFDRVYSDIKHRENGEDLLQAIGGWNSSSSSDPYVRDALRREADAVLSGYQDGLSPPSA